LALVRPESLRGPPDVTMMQATDFADGHDLAHRRRLDRPPIWRVLREGEVSPGAMVVRDVLDQDVSQVALAEDEDVVETLSPDRADKAFREGILPRLWAAVRTSWICMPLTRWRKWPP
jgi:hypothetical protein